MSKAIVIIKSMGIGDLSILISNIHAISKEIDKPVTVLAQKNTRAKSILQHDPHIAEIIELDEKEIKGFFNIIKKIKPKIFDQSYIFSDSIRLYLISKLSGIKKIFHYRFFSKKGKNFCKTIKEFTERKHNLFLHNSFVKEIFSFFRANFCRIKSIHLTCAYTNRTIIFNVNNCI